MMNCCEIGGYLSLELNNGESYHKKAIELNTARNAFEYILKVNRYSKVYLPYYTCEVMLEPLHKLNVAYEFYQIDKDFYPEFETELDDCEAFVYTNYWGINQHNVNNLSKKIGKHLIVDNSQAFYSKPLNETNTFYSARKFFGVADGAYLYCNNSLNENIEQDVSYARMSHLLKRIDLSAEAGYTDFKQNDSLLKNQPIKYMSKLTKAILANVNYDYIAKKRRENFLFLHDKLKDINELSFNLDGESVPMVYPLLFKSENLKNELIKNKVFVATYWPMVKDIAAKDSFELYLYNYLLPLPVDQRYCESSYLILDRVMNLCMINYVKYNNIQIVKC